MLEPAVTHVDYYLLQLEYDQLQQQNVNYHHLLYDEHLDHDQSVTIKNNTVLKFEF